MVITDESGARLFDTSFKITNVVDNNEGKTANRRVDVYFEMDVFDKKECWLTFFDDPNHIELYFFGENPYTVNLFLIDKKQMPGD